MQLGVWTAANVSFGTDAKMIFWLIRASALSQIQSWITRLMTNLSIDIQRPRPPIRRSIWALASAVCASKWPRAKYWTPKESLPPVYECVCDWPNADSGVVRHLGWSLSLEKRFTNAAHSICSPRWNTGERGANNSHQHIIFSILFFFFSASSVVKLCCVETYHRMCRSPAAVHSPPGRGIPPRWWSCSPLQELPPPWAAEWCLPNSDASVRQRETISKKHKRVEWAIH